MNKKSKSAAALKRQEAARLAELQATQRRQLVDEFGLLDGELLPVRHKQRRLEELGRLIRSWYKEEDPEVTYTAEGLSFHVTVGPAGMQTHLATAEALYEVLGHEGFLAAASITLKELERRCDASAVAALTRKERTGVRTLLVAPTAQ